MEREKVLKGLAACRMDPDWAEDCRKLDCPYCGEGSCVALLANDAYMLLMEQEPRVMTLEEVLALKFDDVVYLEAYPTEAVMSAIVIDVIPKLPDIPIGVVQFRHGAGYNGINNADLGFYGKMWRCWTSRPTDAQREAEPWGSG